MPKFDRIKIASGFGRWLFFLVCFVRVVLFAHSATFATKIDCVVEDKIDEIAKCPDFGTRQTVRISAT